MRRNSIFFLISVVFSLLSGCTASNNNAEGVKYFGQARYDLAVQSFQAANRADPNNPDAYYNIAATYHQLGLTAQQTGQAAVAQQQFDYAEQNYKLCLARNPNDAAAYRGLSVLYMQRQNPKGAFDTLIGWTESNPMSAESKIELARLYQEYAAVKQSEGNAEATQACQQSAVASLQAALAVEPNNARALRALGFLREQGGDMNQAVNNYRLSLQANPNQQDLAARLTQIEQNATVGAASVYNPGSGLYNPSGTGSQPGATVYKPTTTPTTMMSDRAAKMPF